MANLLGLLFYLLLLGQPDALVNVVVTWDSDGDGEREGVGPGVTVAVYEEGDGLVQIGNTGPSSSVLFSLPSDTYVIEAYPRRTHSFYEWVCSGSFFVGSDRVVDLRCVERFVLRLPWTHP